MGYTVAQVQALVARVDTRTASIEAKLDVLIGALAGAPVGATQAPAASTPVAIPAERKPAKVRAWCAKHAEHGAFSANGMAHHRGWCDGATLTSDPLAE